MKKFIFWFILFNLLTFNIRAMEKEIDLSACQSKNEENFICFQIPKITVRKLFEELIIEDSYEGWSIDRKSLAPLIYWTQQGIYKGRRQNRLAQMRDYFLPVYPVTKAPIKIDADHADFFTHLDKKIPTDGSMMGMKYVFFPNSVLRLEDDDPENNMGPIYFYLYKEIPQIENINSCLGEFKGDHWKIELDEIQKSNKYYHDIVINNFLNQNEPQLKEKLLEIAKLGHPMGQYILGIYHTNKFKILIPGLQRNFSEGMELLRKVAIQGAPFAQIKYAELLCTAEGNLKNFAIAREMYYQAAIQDNSAAQNDYGCLLMEGKGGAIDIQNGRNFILLSALQGNAQGQYNYATILLDGIGEKKDLQRAREFYYKSAIQGHHLAQFCFAVMAFFGGGGEVDLKSARKFMRLAAIDRNPKAQYYYAWMLENGHGGPVDILSALNFYRESGAKGNSEAEQAYYRLKRTF